MRFQTHVSLVTGRIDAAPMITVMFLLLIFFVLSSSFVLQQSYKVDLPMSDIKSPGAFQGLVVTVARNNALFFNDQLVSMEDLQKALREAAARRHGPQELVIKADRQVPHGTVVEIISLAIAAGIPSVNIATRPEVPVSGAP